MSNPPMMKCGHAANATQDGKPCCVICAGIKAGYDVIDDVPPNLDGRMARCSSCGKTHPSSPGMPFFSHRPDSEFDSYYCGCRGWD